MADVLQVQWFHISLRAWLIAALTATIVFAGLMLLRRLVLSRIGAISGKTTNRFDDMLKIP